MRFLFSAAVNIECINMLYSYVYIVSIFACTDPGGKYDFLSIAFTSLVLSL